MEDRELTDKVLEALSLKMKEGSLAKQISELENLAQVLSVERQRIEEAKKQFAIAQSSAIRAAQVAREIGIQVDKAIKDVRVLADRVIEASREADKFAAMTKRVVDFDTPIANATAGIEQVNTSRKQITKDVAVIKARREELKKEGVNIDTSSPARMSI